MKKSIVLGFSMAMFGFFGNSTEAMKSESASKEQRMGTRIAFVNVQKIVPFDPQGLSQGSLEWKDLYTKIQEVLEPDQKEIRDLKDKFEKGKKEFQNLQASGLTSQEALKRKYEEVAKIEYEYSMRAQEAELYAQNEIKKAQAQLGPKLDKVIEAIRRAQGWDLVLRGEVILGADEKFDITNTVLSTLNKEYSEEKRKKQKPEDSKEKSSVKKL